MGRRTTEGDDYNENGAGATISVSGRDEGGPLPATQQLFASRDCPSCSSSFHGFFKPGWLGRFPPCGRCAPQPWGPSPLSLSLSLSVSLSLSLSRLHDPSANECTHFSKFQRSYSLFNQALLQSMVICCPSWAHLTSCSVLW